MRDAIGNALIRLGRWVRRHPKYASGGYVGGPVKVQIDPGYIISAGEVERWGGKAALDALRRRAL